MSVLPTTCLHKTLDIVVVLKCNENTYLKRGEHSCKCTYLSLKRNKGISPEPKQLCEHVDMILLFLKVYWTEFTQWVQKILLVRESLVFDPTCLWWKTFLQWCKALMMLTYQEEKKPYSHGGENRECFILWLVVLRISPVYVFLKAVLHRL